MREVSHFGYNPQGIKAVCFLISPEQNLSLGNAIEYIVRSGLKAGEPTQEVMQNAILYLEHEIARLKSLV